MRTRHSALSLAAAAALALGLAACSNEGTEVSDLSSTTPAATASATADAAASSTTASDDRGGDPEAAKAASDLALTTASGQKVRSLDFDDDREWEVEVMTEAGEVDVTISADGATVISTGSVDDLDADDRAELDRAIPLNQAIDIAIGALPGTIDDVELDDDDSDGLLTWEVSIYDADGVDHTVHVNAETGEVLSVERD